MRLNICYLMLFFVLDACHGVIDIDNAIMVTVVSPAHFRAGDHLTMKCGPANNKYHAEEYVIRSIVYYTSADPAFNDTGNFSTSTTVFEFAENTVSAGSILCMVEVRSRSDNTLVAYGGTTVDVVVEPFLLPLRLYGDLESNNDLDLSIGQYHPCLKAGTMRKYAEVFDRVRQSYLYQMTTSLTSPDDPSLFYEIRRPATLSSSDSATTMFTVDRREFMRGMNYTFSVSLNIVNTKQVIANGSLTFTSDVVIPSAYAARYERYNAFERKTRYNC